MLLWPAKLAASRDACLTGTLGDAHTLSKMATRLLTTHGNDGRLVGHGVIYLKPELCRSCGRRMERPGPG